MLKKQKENAFYKNDQRMTSSYSIQYISQNLRNDTILVDAKVSNLGRLLVNKLSIKTPIICYTYCKLDTFSYKHTILCTFNVLT